MLDHFHAKEEGTHVWLKVSGLVIVFIILVTVMSILLPPAVDWRGAFRPAALEILQGRSPYNAEGFFNPPWTALLLIPFAILPEHVGRAVLVIIALVVYAYIAYKLGASKLVIVFLLLSPPVLHGILNGNIDWLAALGIVMPTWLGLFFLMIKPQIGLATIFFLLYSTWREGGPLSVIKVFAPFALVLILSTIIFGPWFLSIAANISPAGNASLWPLSVPIGLALIAASIRKNEIRYSMAASPFLSPHVILHSYIAPLLAISSMTYETIAAVIGLWIIVLIRLQL